MNLEILNHPRFVVAQLLIIFASITLHEFGHAISAYRLGDETPRLQGRLNLWPDRHLEPVGTIMIIVTSILGRGIGWGRPVQFNAFGLKHPRRGLFIVAACGPLMNLLLAIVAGLILRVSFATHNIDWLMTDRTPLFEYRTLTSALSVAAYDGQLTTAGLFLCECLSLNLMLLFFNLIPIHPLDGSKILSSLLPLEQAMRYDEFVGQYGPILLFAVAFMFPQLLGLIVDPPVNAVSNLLLGHPVFF